MTAAETEFAPAKVNLALHVTGRRPDGYHLLDSLVVFAPVGDRVEVRPADRLTLRLTGPFAAQVPGGEENLVLRAARLLDSGGGRNGGGQDGGGQDGGGQDGGGRGAAITLDKRLPVASGIGGGSADAAAAIRALARLWRLPLPAPAALVGLGADVPVCLAGQPVRMRGAGERLDPLPGPLPVHMVLVNPGVPVATPEVFARLGAAPGVALHPGLPPIPALADAAAVAAWLAGCRNDLEPAAIALAPDIAAALAALRATGGCLLARMSGSGATCFGLYADPAARDAACARLRAAHPGWWIAS